MQKTNAYQYTLFKIHCLLNNLCLLMKPYLFITTTKGILTYSVRNSVSFSILLYPFTVFKTINHAQSIVMDSKLF